MSWANLESNSRGNDVDCGSEPFKLRRADVTDLEAINELIEVAVMGWSLPERVKRLSLASYRYDEHDLSFLELSVAVTPDPGLIGVAAWEPADPADVPAACTALLLHGLYVAPYWQRRGVGTCLYEAAERAAIGKGLDGVLVKAQADAAGFFRRLGLESMSVLDPERDYPHRYWRALRHP